jgi:hypothetical protein
MSSLPSLQNLPNDQSPNYAAQGILRAFAKKPATAPFRHAVKTSYTPTAQQHASLWDAEETLERRMTSPFARHF